MQKEELQKLIKETVEASTKELQEAQQTFMAGYSAAQQQPRKERSAGELTSQLIGAIAAGKGDQERAIDFAKKRFGADDDVVKALTSGDASAGGFLISEGFDNDVIELLRNNTVVRGSNPVVMPMPNGNLTMPRIDGAATASYVGESTDRNATEQDFGQVKLTAKELVAIVPVSNRLLAMGSVQVDSVIQRDLTEQLAVREDQAFIRDDGTAFTPKGMRHWAQSANITSSNGTSSPNVEQDFQDLFEDLMGNNVRMLRPHVFMSSRSFNHLRNLRDANGNLTFPEIRSQTPTIYGRVPVRVTNNIPNNLGGGSNESEVYLVDMADAVIGESEGLLVEASDMASYNDSSGTLRSSFTRNETVIKATMMHDFAMRHAASIAVKTGVTWGV